MPEHGDARYNAETKKWEQYRKPPGVWEEQGPEFGDLDRPVDVEMDAADVDDVSG